MDYFAVFDISAAGMAVQKARVDTVATNLANANTTRGPDGMAYNPLEVVISHHRPDSFDQQLTRESHLLEQRVVAEVMASNRPPKLVYEPEHPHADSDGYVAYPDIDPVSQMVDLMEATRNYEANVRAVNVAKAMALNALEIGGR